MNKTVPEIFEENIETYKERQASYGPTYRHYGTIMMGLFPNGIRVNDAETWNRLGVVQACVTKLARFCHNLDHIDSAHDLSVYAAILEELTREHHSRLAGYNP
jgi:hypothetical protein